MLEIRNNTGGNLPLLEIVRKGKEIKIGAAPVIKHQKKDGFVVATRIENKPLEEKYMKLIESKFSNPVMRLYLETGKLVILKDGRVEEKKVKKGAETVVVKNEIPGIDIMKDMYFAKSEENGLTKWKLEKVIDEAEEEAKRLEKEAKEEAKIKELIKKRDSGETLTAKDTKLVDKYEAKMKEEK